MTPTPTIGAADMLELIEAYAEARHRHGHSIYNAQTAAAPQAVKDALATGQATAAPAQADTQPDVDTLAEAEYFIDNPSAWSHFDQRASDAMAAVCKAFRAARAPADSVLEDAARYRLLRRGQHWSVIDGIGNDLRAEALDAAVDAARKQGEKQ